MSNNSNATNDNLQKLGFNLIEQISNYRLFNKIDKKGDHGKISLIKFQEKTLLLQYVIYYSSLSDDGMNKLKSFRDDDESKYWFKHIETAGFKDFLKEKEEDRKQPNRKIQEIEEIFKSFRESNDTETATEFVNLLNILKGDGRIEPADFFTENEIENKILYVLDGEMSFFSLLFILAHLFKISNVSKVNQWIDTTDNAETLESIFSPKSDNSDNFEEASFFDAMRTLGLVKLEEKEITERYTRMINWLKSSEPNVIIHPSLSLLFLKTENIKKLDKSEFVKVILKALSSSSEVNYSNLQGFIKELFKSLSVLKVGYKQETDNIIEESILKDISLSTNIRVNIGGEYILRKNESIDRSFFAIPLIYLPEEIGQGDKVGSFAVGTIQEVEEIANFQATKKSKKDILKVLKAVLSELSRELFDKEVFKTIAKSQNKTKEEAVKSAKAAIMSRNMSHNLGSHVLSYLKESLKDVRQILDDNLLDNIGNALLGFIPAPNKNIYEFLRKEDVDLKLPFLVGLGNLISYLQERQDFIATIATDFIPGMSTINFKNFVYDIINSDLKHIRHEKTNMHISKNILLDNIARSEGYRRQNIQICYKTYNGLNEVESIPKSRIEGNLANEKDAKELKTWARKIPQIDTKEYSDHENNINSLREVEIDLPGGLLGRQALFSIFENLIRNTAKHNDKKKGFSLSLTIDIIEFNYKNNWVFKHHAEYKQNIEAFEKKYPCDEFNVFSITDNMQNANKKMTGKTVKDLLNEHMSKPLINDQDSSQNEAHKGMKELKISAQWLLGKEYSEELIPIWFSLENPNDDSNENSNLRLNFFVKKPKKLAVISDEIDMEKDKYSTIFNSPTCNLYNVKKFKELESNMLNHNLIVTDCKLADLGISNYNKISAHAFQTSTVSIKKCLEDSKKDSDIAYIKLYEKYFVKMEFYKSNHEIIIDDEKVSESNITKHNYADKIKVREEYTDNSIIYKTHLSTDKEFRTTYNSIKKNNIYPEFIESITGHNSSDRWIRHTPWDELWYLKNIESAKTKVIIIDERIYDAKVNKKNKNFLNHLYACKFLKQSPDPGLLYSVNKELYYIAKEEGHFKNDSINIDEIITDVKKQILPTIIPNIVGKSIIPDWFNKEAVLNDWKNLSILDIDFKIKVKKNGKTNFPLFDLFLDHIGWVEIVSDENSSISGGNKCQATISLQNENYEYIAPHFLFIHQGLIDKLSKCEIDFGELKPTVLAITHSGRSKPDKLSEDHAFVPFSLLSQLVEETKLALTDLCYTSKVE